MSRMSKAAIIRAGGILGGAGALFVGGLLVAGTPAYADNGPHVSMSNPSSTDSQAGIGGALGGGCASCHRAHSAQATTDLLKTSDEVALCESCHGPTGNGATTNVMDGVAYNGVTGALRGGGFDNAALNTVDATRGRYFNDGTRMTIDKTQNVISATAPTAASSKHNVGATGQTIWGNGAFSASANYGKTGVTLECSSCHDPHGNGNFRILRSVPTDSAATLPAITGASASGSTVTYTLASPYFPLNTGQVVSVTGNSNAEFNVTKATITGKTDLAPADGTFRVTAFQVVLAAPPASSSGTGGAFSPVFPDVAKGTPAPMTVTTAAYSATLRQVAYTVAANKLTYGSRVSVTDNSNAEFNVSNATVVAASGTSFSVSFPTAPSVTTGAGGTAQGATVDYDYTTTNYWLADPNAQAPINTAGNSSFIANVSQWCSTCHTRYLSTGGAGRTINTGDAVFRYRHTSANGKQNSPNCLQCHVAHGSNAVMSGTSASTAADSPGAAPNGDHSSKLLRVNNRGVCQLCHNK
jgi:predicted CXXCH cytochrome family protein